MFCLQRGRWINYRKEGRGEEPGGPRSVCNRSSVGTACGSVRNKEQETEPGRNEALVLSRLKPTNLSGKEGFKFLEGEGSCPCNDGDCP